MFYRGYDVYDQTNVGFVSCPEPKRTGAPCSDDAERIGTPYDVSERGSGNQGHVYSTDLPVKDKDALVEYLKAL